MGVLTGRRFGLVVVAGALLAAAAAGAPWRAGNPPADEPLAAHGAPNDGPGPADRNPRGGSAADAGCAAPAALLDGNRWFDRVAFERAVAVGGAAEAFDGARILLVPHHWLAARLIVASLQGAAAAGGATEVIIVGPDHHGVLPRQGATSASGWASPYGPVAPNADSVDSLLATGLVSCQDALLRQEHSIAGLVSAIRYFFPGASVTPLAVRNDLSRREARALGGVLGRLALSRPRLLVVISVDFSHGLDSRSARANDRDTIEALANLDSGRVAAFDSRHVDAGGALLVAFEASDYLDSPRFVLVERSDSSRMGRYAGGPVTSYVVGYYRSGRD